MIIIGIFLSSLLFLETRLISGNTFLGYGVDFNLHRIIFEIFYYFLPPFLWVVSYFRLTEKQV